MIMLDDEAINRVLDGVYIDETLDEDVVFICTLNEETTYLEAQFSSVPPLPPILSNSSRFLLDISCNLTQFVFFSLPLQDFHFMSVWASVNSNSDRKPLAVDACQPAHAHYHEVGMYLGLMKQDGVRKVDQSLGDYVI
jgi:hypothetical protein